MGRGEMMLGEAEIEVAGGKELDAERLGQMSV